MDHAAIDELQVVERYLAGRLPADEATRFEEHSLACPECLDRLEVAETLRRGLRGVAAQEVTAGMVRATLLARIARSRAASWALGFLFLAALLPSFYWARESGKLEAELAAARPAGTASPTNAAPQNRPGPRTAPPETPGEIAALRAEIAASKERAEAERQERLRLAAELARAQGPRINLAVVPLSPERSAPGPLSPPSTRIALAPGMDWVVLALELNTSDHPSYQATLAGSGGATLWRGADLLPDASGTLNVALPAALLPNGDLALDISGLPSKTRPTPVARFVFRVSRSR